MHCPPLDRAYKSKPLAHYPENVPWNPFDAHGICMLSLPQGLRFRKHALEPHFHSFATTREDGKRCHGFSLIFYEEVQNQDICNAMHILQVNRLDTFPFHTILLSENNFPYLVVHCVLVHVYDRIIERPIIAQCATCQRWSCMPFTSASFQIGRKYSSIST